MKQKTCIIIVGPTATGKTSLAIQLADDFQTEIISADSRQCFKEMTIGVAKPSPAQLQQVKHYFINSHSIHDNINAALFEQYALQAIDQIFQKNDMAIMAGGTGMYVKAFCEGMDAMPEIKPGIREHIQELYKRSGMSWLQKEVQQHDPVYYAGGEILNPQRLMRALEIKWSTGRSIREFQKGKKARRDFKIIKIGINLPKQLLHRNIDNRVDEMIRQGLTEEVMTLLPFRSMNALQTVAYNEMFDYADGKYALQQTIELIKRNTKQYAKRQLTWFRKDVSIEWLTSPSIVNIRGLLR